MPPDVNPQVNSLVNPQAPDLHPWIYHLVVTFCCALKIGVAFGRYNGLLYSIMIYANECGSRADEPF